MILSYRNKNLISGLTYYWKLDTNSNDSINSNNGVDNGIAYVSGKINGAANFTGGTSKITITPFTIDNTVTKTLSCWFKLNKFPVVLFTDTVVANNGYIAAITSNYHYFGDYVVGGTFDHNFEIGVWYNLVQTFNSGVVRSYVNGVESISGPKSLGVGGHIYVNYFGGYDPSVFDLNGQMDEIALWNRVLSQNEINQLYNSGTGTQYPFSKILSYPDKSMQQNLVASWNFDGNLNEATGQRIVTAGTANYSFSYNSKVNQALSLDKNQLFTFGFTPTNALSSWTYSIWMYVDITNVTAFVFNNIPTTDALWIDNNLSNITTVSFFSSGVQITYVINKNTWYHVLLTKSGTNMEMFINGISVGTNSAGSATPMVFQQFGYNGFGTFLGGQYDALNIYNRVLSQTEILKLYNGGAGIQYPFCNTIKRERTTISNGLIGFWNFNGNITSEVNSFVMSGNNYTFSTGKINESVFIDGSASTNITAVNTKSTFSFIQNTGIFTINLWIKPNNFNDSFSYVMGTINGISNGFYIEFHLSDVYFFLAGNSSYVFPFGSAALTSNEWTMVTITGDISAINFYRNSVLISTNPPFTLPSSGDSTGDLSLSSLVDTGSSAKPHYKDCVGIWNRALSLSEIGILYNSGSGYELK